MQLVETEMSCGVMQMEDVTHGGPHKILMDLGEQMYNDSMNCAFVTWSDRWGRNRGGNKLYHFIKHRFPQSGLQRTKTARNPNSNNIICLYTWKIPRGFKKWWKERDPNKKCSNNKVKNDWCSVHKCYPECCSDNF